MAGTMVQRVQCSSCARRFAPERLTAHQRVCTPAVQGFRPTVTSFGSAPSVADGWLADVPERADRDTCQDERGPCDHCGRNFALSRLTSHRRICARSSLVSFRAIVAALDADEGVGERCLAASEPREEESAGAVAASYVPCPRCGRRFDPDRISTHDRICAPPEQGFRATITRLGEDPTPAPHWAPAEAPPAVAGITDSTDAVAVAAVEGRLPCEYCGRSFHPDRLNRHRDGCVHRSLPGFRAQVAALEEEAHKYEVARQAEQEVAAARKLVLEGLRREEELKVEVGALNRKLEMAQAATGSMEAAYDVASEDAREVKVKLCAAQEKINHIEEELARVRRKAEMGEAAAKSMEAAFDVASEDAKDAKARLSAAQEKIKHLEEELARVGRKAEMGEAAAKSIEAASNVASEDAKDAKARLSAAQEKIGHPEEELAKASRRAEMGEVAARSMEAAYDVASEDAREVKKKLSVAHETIGRLEEELAKASRMAEMGEAAAKSMEAAHDVVAEEGREARAKLVAAQQKVAELEAALTSK